MAAYSLYAFLAYGLVLLVLQRVINRRYRTAATANAGDVYGRMVGILLMSVLLWPAAKSLPHQPVRVLPMVIGTVIILTGMAISLYAQLTLGRNWIGGVGLRKQHQLITTGPYRYVRHPLYSGLVVSAIGLGVFSLNVWFFLMSMCFYGGFLLRIPAEERMLRAKFKSRYEAYAAHTGLLVPKLRRGS